MDGQPRIEGPVEVTEHVLALARLPRVCPYGHRDIYGRLWTVQGRLWQARMWREYAQAWDGREIDRGFVGWPHGHRVVLGRAWMEKILKVSRADCIRRARANLYLARRIRRRRRRPIDADSTAAQ